MNQFRQVFPHRTVSLEKAEFVRRPNRFVAYVQFPKRVLDAYGRAYSPGSEVKVHVPDPGRLKELLVPGREVWVGAGAADPKRRTAWSLLLSRGPDPGSGLVSLDTQAPNRLVGELFATEWLHTFTRQVGLESFPGETGVRREVTVGKSRIDFLLEKRVDETCVARAYVEVKSVSLVVDGCARFPDAPTVRGLKHVHELKKLVQDRSSEIPTRACVLFVVQRNDALEVRPNWETDPDFSAGLKEAQEAGVYVQAIAFAVDPKGFVFDGERPVYVNPDEVS